MGNLLNSGKIKLIIGIFIIIGLYLKFTKNKPVKPEERANDVLDSSTITLQNTKDYYKRVASELANNLGTSYSFFDPRNWTENDNKAFELMQPLSKNDVKIISDLYFEVYAKGRDLRQDLSKLLDAKLYEQLKNI